MLLQRSLADGPHENADFTHKFDFVALKWMPRTSLNNITLLFNITKGITNLLNLRNQQFYHLS